MQEGKRRNLILLVALALFTVACTGRLPARLSTKQVEKVEKVEAPQEQAGGTTSPTAGQQATATATAPATSAPTRKIIARTSTGTTISQTASGLPIADIWPPDQDRVGLSANQMKLCMHFAAVLGPAFDNSTQDEDVYWRVVNDSGGIFGRKVSIRFTDDAYTAGGTTIALDQCKEDNPFLYLGGVGFDQAPAGRTWAESNRLPYLYNMAAAAGNLKYSFSFLPTIETNGGTLGQFAASRFQGKKVGAIYVDTDNWRSGFQEFDKELKKRGMRVEPEHSYKIVNNNHPDFGQFIAQMQRDGIQLVLPYINALAVSRFIAQADAQSFHPLLVHPDGFDLVTDIVGNRPPSRYGSSGDGVDHMRNFAGIYAAWTSMAYEIGPPAEKDNRSVAWYSEMQAMKAAYNKYGVKSDDRVNDIDWMFWQYSKALHQMLLACSKDCSRNILAGLMLTGYKQEILGCPVDFSLGAGRVGGHYHHIYQSQPAGLRSYWRQIETCKRGF